MEGLYKNKYRIKSVRLSGWDYGADAYYFVTICTDARVHYFGRVVRDDGGDASVALNGVGVVARDCWNKIPNHFENVILDEYMVMPNHFHGWIQICKNSPKRDDKNVIIAGDNKQSKSTSNPCGRDAIYRVSNDGMNVGNKSGIKDAINRVSTGAERGSKIGGVTGKYNPMLGMTLGTIVRWFKGRTTYECNQQNLNFKWQTRYYDSIIRNEETLNRVREYIQNNPKMWYRDRNNLQGIFM